MGAPILAAKGSLRLVVKLSILTPMSIVEILQNSILESMINFNHINNCILQYYNYNYKTISLGSGIGTSNETVQFVFSLLSETQAQMVIDADAINILANPPKWIKNFPKIPYSPPITKNLKGSWVLCKTIKKNLNALPNYVKNTISSAY